MYRQVFWALLLVAIHLYSFGVEFGEVTANLPFASASVSAGSIPLVSQMEAAKAQGRSITGPSAKFSGMRRK